jgi:hypothetical protein
MNSSLRPNKYEGEAQQGGLAEFEERQTMSKKIMLLALAAVSVLVYALPSAASAADIPLHLNPSPVGSKTVDGIGEAKLSTTSGLTVTCNSWSGSATFETGGTTGSLDLTFSGDCRENIFGTTCTSSGQPSGTIKTTTLPFHLNTLANSKPGVLVTPSTGTTHFATFTCGFITTKVEGNGVIGTITSPECGKSSTSATISFKATSHGQQEHKKIAGTETIYDLNSGGNTAAQEAHGTITMGTSTTLECS